MKYGDPTNIFSCRVASRACAMVSQLLQNHCSQDYMIYTTSLAKICTRPWYVTFIVRCWRPSRLPWLPCLEGAWKMCLNVMCADPCGSMKRRRNYKKKRTWVLGYMCHLNSEGGQNLMPTAKDMTSAMNTHCSCRHPGSLFL